MHTAAQTGSRIFVCFPASPSADWVVSGRAEFTEFFCSLSGLPYVLKRFRDLSVQKIVMGQKHIHISISAFVCKYCLPNSFKVWVKLEEFIQLYLAEVRVCQKLVSASQLFVYFSWYDLRNYAEGDFHAFFPKCPFFNKLQIYKNI